MTVRPLAPCNRPGCRNTTRNANRYCDDCQTYYQDRQRTKEMAKVGEPFYYSHRWRKLRSWFIRQHPVCQQCGKEQAAIVDHIHERSDGGDQYAVHNLQAMCARCHGLKTAAIAKQRRGVG